MEDKFELTKARVENCAVATKEFKGFRIEESLTNQEVSQCQVAAKGGKQKPKLHKAVMMGGLN